AGRRLQHAFLYMDRIEWRFLNLCVDLPQRVATGKKPLVARNGRCSYGNGHREEYAAGRPFLGNAACAQLDCIRIRITPGGTLKVVGRVGLAEIAPGASVFFPVDGVVE